MENSARSSERFGSTSSKLLGVIAIILVIAALKYSQSVTLPLAFAFFIVALAWPLQKRLCRHMPQKSAFFLTFLLMVLAFFLFCAALFACAAIIAKQAPNYSDEATQMYAKWQSWGTARGIQFPEAGELKESLADTVGLSTLKSGARRFVSLVGMFVLTIAFFGLGLLEARRIHRELRETRSEASKRILHSLHHIAHKFQSYFLVRSAVSGIQGVCTFVFSLVIGLDFAIIWGVQSALLNYIPTLGSMVAVIPPTLWALFEFQSVGMALVVFFGNCLIQVVLGSFVDPLLEAKQLQLSPLAVLFSIAFWGWVWGVGGALIGVPIAVAIAIVCREFPSTAWISDLLTANRGNGDNSNGDSSNGGNSQDDEANSSSDTN